MYFGVLSSFFLFKQKTAYDLRISDWSSDVCSSDLMTPDGAGGVTAAWTRRSRLDTGWRDGIDLPLGESRELYRVATLPAVAGVGPWEQIGRASCRERVCQYV